MATFKEIMAENGYEVKTTFWNDFSIADKFGAKAVIDTYNRAFKEWKENHIYLTELVLVLNHKIWQFHQTNEPLAKVYNELWGKTDNYGCENLKGEELNYFYNTLD